MAQDNLSILLAERPVGEIIPDVTFKQKIAPAPTPADLKDGEILVEVLYLSLDPAMRGWLNDARSYLPPVQIGDVMRGASVSRVIASKSKQAVAGDFVFGPTGWTQYAILREGAFEPAANFPGLTDPKDMLSALGITSITAWIGMINIGEPKAGETVVVSGAAGATGSIAGQLAKIKGARVVGLAGSDDKCKWLVEDLGFDVALNYKDADFKQKFKEATPDYIDVYFDNVGGEILEMCLARAKEHARFVMCGGISQYSSTNPQGPKNISLVIAMRIKMQGFIVLDHVKEYKNARQQLSQWLSEGKIKKTEHILPGGLQITAQGLVDMYKGSNTGKLLVEVKNPKEALAKL
ncbi:hypothetical protein Trco_004922 [Trichoderma cornu-damae]|uniref:Dehydrogenase FUB6 n=1 Tax=Trichoderma cornu-damae TaxID=654480 RepID=A0A9P8TVZ5_9HYPO|nr:hypothetical protein Trco_004922 [Trichoderma cornu-damae]